MRYNIVTATQGAHVLELQPRALAAFVDSLSYHEDFKFVCTLSAQKSAYVYRARRVKTDVCIKISPSQSTSHLPVEADVLWRCSSSNTHFPRVLGIFFLDGMCALVMDWVEGSSTNVRLKDLKQYTLQLLSALRTLHSRGYFSRDVKPHNIIWNSHTRHLTLLDFDLAACAHSSHAVQVGTPGFLALEVLANQPYRAWIDIHACALTLFAVYKRSWAQSTESERTEFNREEFVRIIYTLLAKYDTESIDHLEEVTRKACF